MVSSAFAVGMLVYMETASEVNILVLAGHVFLISSFFNSKLLLK